MGNESRAKGKLRITAGAGEGYEVDPEVAAKHRGQPVRDALLSIIQDEVHDPELRQMLLEPRLALELYGDDEDGQPQEVPLSPTERWDQVLQKLEKADVEVGIARSHAGGVSRRVERHRRNRTLDQRFPRQRVVTHPVEYQLTDDDRVDVRNGQAVFFTGEVLAKAECICRELGDREALWYYAASSRNTCVIEQVIIPKQTGSGVHCQADGTDVLNAARSARKQRLTIVGAGHSHGRLGVFSSGTDWEQMAELAKERVARTSEIRKTVKGQARQAVRSDDGVPVLEATFSNGSPIAVRITAEGGASRDACADGLTVELEQTRRRSMSWFATHNRYGQHLLPMLETVSCPQCGSEEERRVDAADVVVHIIGPVKLSDKTREALRREVRDKVSAYSSWSYGSSRSYEDWTSEESGEAGTATCDVDSAETYAAEEPAPFEVYRRGRIVGSIPAATLERAAAESAPLALALGWGSMGVDTNEKERPTS